MQRLVQLWGSGEVTWRRLRKSSTEERRDENHPEATAPAIIEQVEARLRKQARTQNRTIFDPGEVFPETNSVEDSEVQPAPGDGLASHSRIIRKDLDQKYRYWQSRALKLAQELRRRDAALAAEPSVQFPLAAIH